MKLAAVGTIRILSATPDPLEKGVGLPVLMTGDWVFWPARAKTSSPRTFGPGFGSVLCANCERAFLCWFLPRAEWKSQSRSNGTVGLVRAKRGEKGSMLWMWLTVAAVLWWELIGQKTGRYLARVCSHVFVHFLTK